VLRLIKTVVAKRGNYSYLSLSNIFLEQVQQVSFAEFKRSLHQYLIFSSDKRDNEFVAALKVRLTEKLDALYVTYESQRLTDALILRTANRVIDFLTTENRRDPSPLFVLLLSQGNPMTLVVTLLKLVLISRNSRLYLEARIADLIQYYQDLPEQDCWWVVNFLEIFNVTFTIYAENVQYNLIQMNPDRKKRKSRSVDQLANLDAYRVFSQSRLRPAEAEATLAEDAMDMPEGDDEALVIGLIDDEAVAIDAPIDQPEASLAFLAEVKDEITEIQV
jgi:hypothetical protein